MGEERKLTVRVVLAGIIALTFIIWALFAGFGKEFAESSTVLIVGIIILVFAIFYFKRNYPLAKKKLPLEDERSRRIMDKAMASAYLVMLYFILAIMYFSETDISKYGWQKLTPYSTALIIMLAMVASFVIFWIYYNHKGDVG